MFLLIPTAIAMRKAYKVYEHEEWRSRFDFQTLCDQINAHLQPSDDPVEFFLETDQEKAAETLASTIKYAEKYSKIPADISDFLEAFYNGARARGMTYEALPKSYNYQDALPELLKMVAGYKSSGTVTRKLIIAMMMGLENEEQCIEFSHDMQDSMVHALSQGMTNPEHIDYYVKMYDAADTVTHQQWRKWWKGTQSDTPIGSQVGLIDNHPCRQALALAQHQHRSYFTDTKVGEFER